MNEKLSYNSDFLTYGQLIASRLKRLMQNRGNISVTQLARAINVPQPTLHRLLAGETCDPRASTLSALADFFDVKIDYFLCENASSLIESNYPHIPILEWEESTKHTATIKAICENPDIDKRKWVQVDIKLSPNSFALLSKKSISTMFPMGAILIIDTGIKPCDGDFVLFTDESGKNPTIRELIIDGSEKILRAFTSELLPMKLSKETVIIGVLAQMKLNYKK